MKYAVFIIGCGILATSLMFFAQAATDQSPTPTVLPGQTLYFFELLKEKIQILTTVGPTAKAQLYLDLANLRLAEYKALAQEGKNDLAKKSFDQYLEKLKLAIQNIQILKKQNKSVGVDTNDIATQLQNQTQDLSTASQALNQVLPDKLSRAQQIAKQSRELIQNFVFTKPLSAASSSKTTWLEWLQKMFDKFWPNNLQLIKK